MFNKPLWDCSLFMINIESSAQSSHRKTAHCSHKGMDDVSKDAQVGCGHRTGISDTLGLRTGTHLMSSLVFFRHHRARVVSKNPQLIIGFRNSLTSAHIQSRLPHRVDMRDCPVTVRCWRGVPGKVADVRRCNQMGFNKESSLSLMEHKFYHESWLHSASQLRNDRFDVLCWFCSNDLSRLINSKYFGSQKVTSVLWILCWRFDFCILPVFFSWFCDWFYLQLLGLLRWQ